MKSMVICYIKSDDLINEIEDILDNKKFDIIESNKHYRVFLGHVPGNIINLVESLNKELADVVFDKEDSMFVIYPSRADGGSPSFSNIIIKRKGNKHLRAGSLFK